MSDKTKVEKGTNVDGKFVSQPIAKPRVARSLCLSPKMSVFILVMQLFIVIVLSIYLPENINWYIALFSNSVGFFFGLLVTKLYERY